MVGSFVVVLKEGERLLPDFCTLFEAFVAPFVVECAPSLCLLLPNNSKVFLAVAEVFLAVNVAAAPRFAPVPTAFLAACGAERAMEGSGGGGALP